jgi:hypothetical protein
MRSQARYVLLLVAGVGLAGCRQADGPLPAPNPTVQEELVDVAHDLENIAKARDPQAPKDLADDLRKYTSRRPSAEPVVDELSSRTAKVVAGSKLTEQLAQQLAHNLWLSIAARELSERQIETLQNDMQSLLMSFGVVDTEAQNVAAQVGVVQRAVTDRGRRWYELF